ARLAAPPCQPIDLVVDFLMSFFPFHRQTFVLTDARSYCGQKFKGVLERANDEYVKGSPAESRIREDSALELD
ncbi:hypothetical protein BaRGS_00000682, partial [Batillaria attramentaria]